MSDKQLNICEHMPDNPDVDECHVCGFRRKCECEGKSYGVTHISDFLSENDNCEVCNQSIK